MTTVAGLGWEALCGSVSTEGFNVRGVGGDVARSTGTGSLTITFMSGREGLWLPSTGLRYFGSSKGGPAASSIKVHTDDHTNFPATLSIWEGQDLRKALVVDIGADAERSDQSARQPSEAHAARQGWGTPLRTADEAMQRLGITNSRLLKISTRFPTAWSSCPSLGTTRRSSTTRGSRRRCAAAGCLTRDRRLRWRGMRRSPSGADGA